VQKKIVYSPESLWLDEFLQSVFENDENIEIEAYESSKVLDEFFAEPRSSFEFLVGIEFDDSLRVSSSNIRDKMSKSWKNHSRIPLNVRKFSNIL
jgi:hypothetical protein